MISFNDALITKFSTKTNAQGSSVATLQLTIESETPKADFSELLNMQRQYVKLTLEQNGKVTD